MDGLVVFLIGLAIVVGVIGTVLPFLPGIALIWVAGLVYGLIAGFNTGGIIAFTLMTLLAVAGKVAALVVPGRRGSSAGAPLSTLLFAAVGALIGAVVIPVIGIFIGGLGAVLLVERVRLGSWSTAWATTKAIAVGAGIGSLLELAAGVGMALCWLAWVLFA